MIELTSISDLSETVLVAKLLVLTDCLLNNKIVKYLQNNQEPFQVIPITL
jgi:hypothetical protein